MTPILPAGAIDPVTQRVMRFFRATVLVVWGLVAVSALAADPAWSKDPWFFGLLLGSLAVELTVTWIPRTWLGLDSRILAQLLAPIIWLSVIVSFLGQPHISLVYWFAVPVAASFSHVRRAIRWLVLGAAAACAGLLVIGLGYSQPLDAQAASIEVFNALALFVLMGVFASHMARGIRNANRRIAELAGRDELTSLMNLRSFAEAAEIEHEQAVRARRPHAILLIDIDELQMINQRYGHDSGDRAIALVASVLSRSLTGDEILGRYSSDKFLLFLPTLEGGRADETARRIRNTVYASTMDVDSKVVRIKVNVGVAKFPVHGVSVPSLINAADADMRLDRSGRTPPGEIPVFRRRSGTTTS